MVKSIVTFSDIIFYWHINDCKEECEKYYIYLDGERVGTTDKTHFTLRNIKKCTADVKIYTDEKGTNLFYSEFFTLPLKPRFIDVSKEPYNAGGDNAAHNIKAIQKAIDDCREGECVYFPKGLYVTGALNLHSNMEVYVEAGAEIKGSEDPLLYLPRIWSRFEGKEMECYSSLINLGNIKDREGIACENVIIHGGGKIFGGGRPLAENVIESERKRLEADPDFKYDSECENNNTIPGRVRPKLINISCAKNVVIDNIELGYGSCWNLHMIYSKDIVTCNCRFESFGVWNGDGWDPDSSENCSLFNCEFSTGDDCVAIKSGKNPEGNVIAKPCKNINVFDCRATNGHGVAIGSEMSGGVSDIFVWDCDFEKTMSGIEIKATKKRGGYVKNIYMTRCRVPRVLMHAVGYNDDGIAAPTVPSFSDCRFENITITGLARKYNSEEFAPCGAITLRGFDDNHKVENIYFNNVTIDNGNDSVMQTLSFQTLKNINITNLNVK